MNIRTGKIVNESTEGFLEMQRRGELMNLAEAEKTTPGSLKMKLSRTQLARINGVPLTKNEAKRRRKALRTR